MLIGEMLVRAGALSPGELEEAVGWQVLYGGRLGTNILELGLVEEKALAEALGKQLACECAWGELDIPEAMVRMIPAVVARRQEIVPWKLDGKRLKVLVASPSEHLQMFDELGFRVGKTVKPVVAPEFRIQQLLRRHFGSVLPMRALDFGINPRAANKPRGDKKEEQAEAAGGELIDDAAFSAIYAQAVGRAPDKAEQTLPPEFRTLPPGARPPLSAAAAPAAATRPPAVAPPAAPPFAGASAAPPSAGAPAAGFASPFASPFGNPFAAPGSAPAQPAFPAAAAPAASVPAGYPPPAAAAAAMSAAAWAPAPASPPVPPHAPPGASAWTSASEAAWASPAAAAAPSPGAWTAGASWLPPESTAPAAASPWTAPAGTWPGARAEPPAPPEPRALRDSAPRPASAARPDATPRHEAKSPSFPQRPVPAPAEPAAFLVSPGLDEDLPVLDIELVPLEEDETALAPAAPAYPAAAALAVAAARPVATPPTAPVPPEPAAAVPPEPAAAEPAAGAVQQAEGAAASPEDLWAAFQTLGSGQGEAEEAPAEDLSPLSFQEAMAQVGKAEGRDAVARTVLRYACSRSARAVLLSIQGGVATGWDALGEDLDPTVARRIALPLGIASAFRLVRESRSHYIGPLGKDPGNVRFLKLAGRKWPASAVLLPILYRGQVAWILYVDNGHKKHVDADVGELLILSQSITRSMEALVAKRQKARAAAG